MKRHSMLIILAALVVIINAAPLFAAMPTTINYQGFLTSATGSPAKGPLSMTFSLYSSNPARNNPVWSETQPAVAVTNGIYSVQLGSVAPITAPFDAQYWMGIKVGADPEMTPLLPLASVPYSFRAGCNPGDMINCYTGPIETLNTGICKAGVRTCGATGSGFGSCVGEVVPAPVTGCNEPACNDTVKNGNETDVDCGGTCPKCPANKVCLVDADCSSNACNGGICAVVTPTCMDGIKNGNETDVDCGGPTCQKCSDLKLCLSASDCGSGVCAGNVCQATTCNDTVKNGLETDVDCGGNCTKCSTGKICAIISDCNSNVCIANICKECDGNNPSSGCGLYTCNINNTCKATCGSDVDCSSGNFCSSGICHPKNTLGTACVSNNACQNGFCVDGYCCDTACSGTCLACNRAGQHGTCGPVPNGTDPKFQCGGVLTCNGAGACQ